MEKIVNLLSLFGQMLCTMYQEHRNQRNTEVPVLIGQATDRQTNDQQQLQNQNENVPFLSPTSMSTILSLPAAESAPPSQQSTAQKALRFLTMPVRGREPEPAPQRLQPPAQAVTFPTAPQSPTFLYRDLPGTPRKLF